MRIFVKFCSSLVTGDYNYFWRYSSLAHLPTAVQVSANFMQKTLFLFKLKFSEEKIKSLRQQGIS